jgi:dihydrofolate synthase/folylpolyglutamate synthase
VVPPGGTVVLGEGEWEGQAREAGAGRLLVAAGNRGVAVAAASAVLDRRLDPGAADSVALPGRFEVVATDPLEIWDGAHNPAGVRHLLALLPEREFVVVASILADKDAGEMLRLLSRAGARLVATESESARALAATKLAEAARPHFETVEAVADPVAAVLFARESAGESGVLVTGSLYLLASLRNVRSAHVPWGTLATG